MKFIGISCECFKQNKEETKTYMSNFFKPVVNFDFCTSCTEKLDNAVNKGDVWTSIKPDKSD